MTKAAVPGRIASLIETCKINDVEPFAYLKSTLEAITAGHPEIGVDNTAPLNTVLRQRLWDRIEVFVTEDFWFIEAPRSEDEQEIRNIEGRG